MKKFLGIVMIIIGAIWGLFMLIALLSGGDVVGVIALLVPAILLLFFGIKLSKSKKVQKQSFESNVKESPLGQQQQENEQREEYSGVGALSLLEVKSLIDEKVAQIPFAGYTLTPEQTAIKFLELNDAKLPFEFMSSDQKNIDLIANWKLADLTYVNLLGLGKNSLQKEFKVLAKFDEKKHVIKCIDQSKSKSAGFSPLGGGMQFSTFSGKSSQVSKEIHFGRKKDGKIGKVADVALDTRILHNVIKEVAEKCGWQVKRTANNFSSGFDSDFLNDNSFVMGLIE